MGGCAAREHGLVQAPGGRHSIIVHKSGKVSRKLMGGWRVSLNFDPWLSAQGARGRQAVCHDQENSN